MLDNIRFKASNYTISEWKSLKAKLLMNPTNTNHTRYGNEYFPWSNLRVEYNHSFKELTVKNSIHKFYNSIVADVPIGCLNHDSFTATNLSKTINYICKTTKRTPEDFKVYGKFEFGVNLNIGSLKPMKLFDQYLSHQSPHINQFYAMPPNSGKVQGKSCFLTNYRIKCYDKSAQPEVNSSNGNIMRYEVVIDGSKHIKDIINMASLTLAEVMKKSSLENMGNFLCKSYNNIKKIPFWNDSNIPMDDYISIVQYVSPALIKANRERLSDWKYAQLRAKQKQIYQNYLHDDIGIHHQIGKQIKQEWYDLTISPLYNQSNKHLCN